MEFFHTAGPDVGAGAEHPGLREEPPTPLERHPLPVPSDKFWSDLNSTLDEFFAVLQSSREKVTELSIEIVKRDNLIKLIEAQNSALRARLGLADAKTAELAPSAVSRPAAAVIPLSPNASTTQDASAADAGPMSGIWQKLSKLDRKI
jgi:hypothetical protein